MKPKKRTKPIQQTSTSENVQFEEENTTRIVPKKQVQSTHDKATSVEHELTQNDEGEVEESSSDTEDTEIRKLMKIKYYQLTGEEKQLIRHLSRTIDHDFSSDLCWYCKV